MRTILYLLVASIFPAIVFAEDVSTPSRLNVGLILPLTGPLAEYGQAFQNGVELAKRDSPKISENCNFSTEDSKYDSKTAVSIFQKFVVNGNTPVVYCWGGPPSDSVAPLADRTDTALFVWSADPRVAEKRERVIRFANSGADYGGTLANFLSAQGYRSVGVVATENQYVNAILFGFQSQAKDKLSIDVVASHLPSEQDFRATITKLKDRKFDALGVFLLSGQVSTFINQLRDQKVAIPIFGTDFFESMTEVSHSGGGMVGAVFANNEVTPGFRKAYVKTFGNDLQINHAANGYDFASLMCGKIKPQLKEMSAKEIVDRSAAALSFSGEQGTAVFTKSDAGDKYFRFPVVIRRIREHEIVTEKESS